MVQLRMGTMSFRVKEAYNFSIVLTASREVIDLGTHVIPETLYDHGRFFEMKCSDTLRLRFFQRNEGVCSFAALILLEEHARSVFSDGVWTTKLRRDDGITIEHTERAVLQCKCKNL